MLNAGMQKIQVKEKQRLINLKMFKLEPNKYLNRTKADTKSIV
jgi:hypothetical protein